MSIRLFFNFFICCEDLVIYLRFYFFNYSIYFEDVEVIRKEVFILYSIYLEFRYYVLVRVGGIFWGIVYLYCMFL